MTDEELIQKFKAGNVNAFNQLVWRWEKPIFNFILKMCGDIDTSKDICQRTFIRAYNSLRKLKSPEKFKSWLYQIALNLCRDEIRSHSKRNWVSLEKIQADSDDGAALPESLRSQRANSPEHQWEKTELCLYLAEALKQIPEEQRVVIIMKEYQGLKFSEIAEILNQSINTIKSRMYYGLTALRKVFEQWEINKEAFEYDV